MPSTRRVATEFLGIRNGVDGSTIDINPNWSADSTRIAFDGRPNITGRYRFPGDPGFGDPSLPPLPIGEPGMWIANVTRPSNTLLLALSPPASQPSFSPDGSHIAFYPRHHLDHEHPPKAPTNTTRRHR